jgi:hypothetical protein
MIGVEPAEKGKILPKRLRRLDSMLLQLDLFLLSCNVGKNNLSECRCWSCALACSSSTKLDVKLFIPRASRVQPQERVRYRVAYPGRESNRPLGR